MKRIYILLAFILQSVFIYSQQFEIRLVQPGGESGIFRVQFRCIDPSVLPTTSQNCTDLAWRIWWDHVANPSIADIDVVQAETYGAHLNEGAPFLGNSNGPGSPNGTIVPIGFCSTCFGFPFPSNWVLYQWVTVATVKICSTADCLTGLPPAGIDASDFLIQQPYEFYPDIGINDEFFYTPAQAPLPLNLIEFDAKKSGERNAHLTWTTANEENTSHFTVQRSYDQKTWTDVGNVTAAGYSVDIRNYELNDFEVYNGRDSRLQVYYRLVMVDLDGRTKLSPIKSVVFGNTSLANHEFLVYPNPASNGVHVEWDVEEFNQPTALEFYDINGKLILTQQVGEKSTQEYVDFTKTTILPGLYLLRVMKGAEPIDYKQIVVGQR